MNCQKKTQRLVAQVVLKAIVQVAPIVQVVQKNQAVQEKEQFQ